MGAPLDTAGSSSEDAQVLPTVPPNTAEQIVQDVQAVNEQLLLAGLRERIRTEQLHEQLTFIRAITNSLTEGVCALDLAGQLMLVNPAAENLLGWAEAEILGKPLHHITSMQPAQDPVALWEGSFPQQVSSFGASYQHVDVVMTRRDGTSFPASYSVAPILINAQVVGVVVSLRDMTEVQRLRQIQDAYVELLSREHARLETQVQERTHELEEANILLKAEINERTRAEQVRQYLLQQLVVAQEEERGRVARELHDQMGQSVTALMLAIKVLHDRVDDASDLRRHVAHLHTIGSQLGRDVRTLAVQLRPPALDDFGLLPTLTTYIEQWSVQALVVADFHSSGLEHIRLPQPVETTVFRVVQEALTNIARHAQATNVSVILNRGADALHLIVEDNGGGFDAQVEQQLPYAERRFGLIGMQERVTQLAGTLAIESTSGSGTSVFVSLPLASSA